MTGFNYKKTVNGEAEQLRKYLTKVEELLQQFELTTETLGIVIKELNTSFELGLSSNSSDVKMLPTFVCNVPQGDEDGDFFALDLGGTNFRVLLVKIRDGQVSVDSEIYAISKELMLGSGEALFDYIAKCLGEFAMGNNRCNNKNVGTVGFTFSFPVNQTSLTAGDLIQWTKGFNVSNVVANDVCQLLREAIIKRGEINVDDIALMNDTTGVMMSCAFYDRDVLIGLILGTGSNACYMESSDKILKLKDDSLNENQMILNTEWGGFGSCGRPGLDHVITQFDRVIDAESLNVGEQKFEKMISGMYLGEIVRLCIIHLIKEDVLFKGRLTNEIETNANFLTKYVSAFCSGQAKQMVEILTKLGYDDANLFECKIIQDICEAVSMRGARLAAAGLTAIIRRTHRNVVTVAIDGSLFKFHPTFKDYMTHTLEELLPNVKVKLRLAEDGSGIGAAMVAAVAQKRCITN